MKSKIHKIIDDGMGWIMIDNKKIGRIINNYFFCEKDFKKHFFRNHSGFGISTQILGILSTISDLKGIRLNVKYDDKEEIWECSLMDMITKSVKVQYYPYEPQNVLEKKYWIIK